MDNTLSIATKYEEKGDYINALPHYEKLALYLKCGLLCEKIGEKWERVFSYFWKEWETYHSLKPLLYIIDHYTNLSEPDWLTAYMFAKMAVKISGENEEDEYTKWHHLGRICWYVEEYKEGLYACNRAIKMKPESGVDKFNRSFYSFKLKSAERVDNACV